MAIAWSSEVLSLPIAQPGAVQRGQNTPWYVGPGEREDARQSFVPVATDLVLTRALSAAHAAHLRKTVVEIDDVANIDCLAKNRSTEERDRERRTREGP